MMACDTNILFPALMASHAWHGAARSFLESQSRNGDFALCELVLLEVYTLLRNPSVCAKPLSASEAVRKIGNLRANPDWLIVDYPGGLMNDIWHEAAKSAAFRRVYDIRLALTLLHHGVTEFATANTKDFQGFGFRRVWNPLGGS